MIWLVPRIVFQRAKKKNKNVPAVRPRVARTMNLWKESIVILRKWLALAVETRSLFRIFVGLKWTQEQW